MIKTIVFDLYNTLIYFDKEVRTYKNLFSDLGLELNLQDNLPSPTHIKKSYICCIALCKVLRFNTNIVISDIGIHARVVYLCPVHTITCHKSSEERYPRPVS